MPIMNKNLVIDKSARVSADTNKSNKACGCSPLLQEGNNELKLYTEGDELYDAMLNSMFAASQRIQLESYIFADDEIGRRFMTVLTERSNAGVDVQIHVDAAGSLFLMSRQFEQEMLDANIRLQRFHKWNWKSPLRYNRRNHRKLLVVDGRTAFVGGFNIHRESSKRISGDLRWRDTHIQFESSLALQAVQVFDHFWQGDRHWMPASLPGSSSELLQNYSRRCRRQLRCVFTDMLVNAKQSIYLSTPYFVPDRHTRNLLTKAARRGIEVCLLVPRKSDVPIARWASQAIYDWIKLLFFSG